MRVVAGLLLFVVASCGSSWEAVESPDWRLSEDRTAILLGPPYRVDGACTQHRVTSEGAELESLRVSIEQRDKPGCDSFAAIATCIGDDQKRTTFSTREWEQCSSRLPLEEPVPAGVAVVLSE